jgi:hypothetical protein
VTVDGEVAASLEVPAVFLVGLHADQVRHNVDQSLVVIAFDPDDFDAALGVGELADVAKELPVFFGEAAEVQVREDVAEEDEAAETVLPQHARRFSRAADLRPQVYVGEN